LVLKGFVREAIGVADNNIKSKYPNLIHKDIDIQKIQIIQILLQKQKLLSRHCLSKK
jgi:hypothetical protein